MRSSALLLPALLWPLTAHAEAPRVVTDIAPIHSLVSQVMQGVAEPYLLVKGTRSPHGYSLKISEARQIDQADLVFWVGEGLTPWLARSVETLGSDATSVELLELEGLTLFGYDKEGHEDHADHGDGHHDDHPEHDDHAKHDHGDHGDEHHDDHDDHAEHDDDHHEKHAAHDEDHHDDHDSHHDHDHGDTDPHIWLDPVNAIVIVNTAARALSERDPENAARYASNAQEAVAALEALTDELTAKMQPAAGTSYIVYHDAYRYFEDRFGLGRAIAVAGSDAIRPGVRRLSEVRALMDETGTRCVFSEVQFGDRAADAITRGTEAREAILDPVGGEVEPGPALYAETLRRLARTFADCLS